MEIVGILVLVLVSILALVAFILAMVRLMGKWFGRLSGWNALAQRFPGPAAMPDGTKTGAVKVGSVFFRYGPRFCPTPQGFYMVYKSVYSYPPLLIPWDQFKNQKRAILFWRSARCLDIGNPAITTLTILEDTYKRMEPYLSELANK
jgi:hypothetical protein